jgi:transcriptional regulator with XRE-family HTH domain
MVGGAVRAARKKAGISQVELARRAGTTQPAIARLEGGRIAPTVLSLDRIARALETELVIDFEPTRGTRMVALTTPPLTEELADDLHAAGDGSHDFSTPIDTPL